jgi:[glutamine synthetase] adenylyltransferase / [glutamine synthetase]-adenylyl-L-tyrosine phosphorylase
MNTFAQNGTARESAGGFDRVLQTAVRHSHYVSRLLDSDPGLRDWLHDHYETPCLPGDIRAWLDVLPCGDEEALSRSLRQLRRRVMLKLAARDLGGLADLAEVMSAMTALAELSVQRAQAMLMRELGEKFGTPVGETSGKPQEMLVIGMGKLGGGELNVSSDIDLIFVYPEDGGTNGAHVLSNHEFFSRLGRRLIASIGDHTADGYVFRVDMRLRPYGDSGPLVMGFAALEEYLVTQGREWERYAWIKARVVSPPDSSAAKELMRLVQPFVFRKYLDFGAFDSMRKLHAQIRAEVTRRERHHNIKLGPGGIREIEFIAQVFQLIRGGRMSSLRIRPTRQVLQQLARTGELGGEIVARLDESYVFLRNLEHRLQYLDDQQTQELPDNPEARELVASAMGYPDYPALLAALDPLRDFVSRQFDAVFGERPHEESGNWWRDGATSGEIRAVLEAAGYGQAAETTERLVQFRSGARYRRLPDSSRQRLDKLVPRLATLCATETNPDEALARILALLETVARRASYLAFLAEYPQALPRLTHLCAASAWASEYLAQHPILLDELLDTREMYSPPDWPALDTELSAQLAECGPETERQMEVLRLFQKSQTFHLLAMDLQGLLPLEKLSDHLSDLADLVLKHVVRQCWNGLPMRHREMPCFAVIGYGKLGGRELGYASDLDLVFLYEDAAPDAGAVYARLAQRISAMLSSYTAAGRLYEVDLRLRPNGDSGLLVSSTASFDEYQRQHAWVWEHQALTRARFCAGDQHIGRKFEHIRTSILRQPRNPDKLRGEIVSMRRKMHDGHPNRSALFDIKHDPGGMVDIEFIVQYLVLAFAHDHAELSTNSGNLALLRLAGELGLIEAQLAEKVCDIYRSLRALQHKMRLNGQIPCRIEPEEIDIAPVRRLWNRLFDQFPPDFPPELK